MATKTTGDPAMAKVRDLFKRSELSLHDLGVKMGYPPESARKSAWQFIDRTDDPRLSMLRKFAKALDVPLAELIGDTKRKG